MNGSFLSNTHSQYELNENILKDTRNQMNIINTDLENPNSHTAIEGSLIGSVAK